MSTNIHSFSAFLFSLRFLFFVSKLLLRVYTLVGVFVFDSQNKFVLTRVRSILKDVLVVARKIDSIKKVISSSLKQNFPQLLVLETAARIISRSLITIGR